MSCRQIKFQTGAQIPKIFTTPAVSKLNVCRYTVKKIIPKFALETFSFVCTRFYCIYGVYDFDLLRVYILFAF